MYSLCYTIGLLHSNINGFICWYFLSTYKIFTKIKILLSNIGSKFVCLQWKEVDTLSGIM